MISKKALLGFVLGVLIILGSLPIAFGWLRKQEELPITITTGEYSISIFVWFDELFVGEASPYYDSDKQVLIINAYDENADNYVEKLKIKVEAAIPIASRIRIKLLDEWRIRREFYDSGLIINEVTYQRADEFGNLLQPFTIPNEEEYIIDLDGYMYYQELLLKETTFDKDIVNGGEAYPIRVNDFFFEECMLHLRIIVDIVQANRYHEVWGIPEDFYTITP